jgi:hypothetical protein
MEAEEVPDSLAPPTFTRRPYILTLAHQNQDWRTAPGTDKGKGKRVNNDKGAGDESFLPSRHRKTPQEQKLEQDMAIARQLQVVEDFEATLSYPCEGDEDLARQLQRQEEDWAIGELMSMTAEDQEELFSDNSQTPQLQERADTER